MSWSTEKAVQEFFNSNHRDGDILSHDWVRNALDYNEHVHSGFELMERVEAFKSVMLKEHMIALRSVRGQGYQIVPPAQQAEYAAREASRYIRKGLLKASSLLENTRRDELTDEEARRHTDTQIRMEGLSRLASRGQRDVFKLFDQNTQP